MRKFIILAATALVSAVVGAYADKKYNLGVKDRVDGFCGSLAEKLSKKAEKSSETTTDNESASTEAMASN